MTKPDRASEVGKQLARLVKKAKPHAQRLAASAKPRVERATDDALKLGHDHEVELKHLAHKLVRARVTGPRGPAVDALAEAMAKEQPTASLSCNTCQSVNSTKAKFCNQCGTRLTERE